MARPTISTGSGIVFGHKAGSRMVTEVQRHRHEVRVLNVAVLGNFSGNGGSRKAGEGSTARPRLIEVDRDNIDEVFGRLNVSLLLPFSEDPLEFAELDDLEPDIIYQRVPLFDSLRDLKRQLRNPDTFDAVAREIAQWPEFSFSPDAAVEADVSLELPDAAQGGSLEDILEFTQEQQALQDPADSKVDALIKSLVRPFTEVRADPRQQPMLAAVDQAISALMRKIMHQSAFQQLEASWRSLYQLVRECESESEQKIYLVDISVEEVASDFAQADTLEDSVLYQLLVASRQKPGDTPMSLMIADYRLGRSERDAMAALALGTIALAGNAACVSGAHEQLFGCPSLAATPDPDDWSAGLEQPAYWQEVRATEAASHLGLVSPRVLLRLPYGDRGLSTDQFPFEELSTPGEHDSYLWGNGAFVAARLLVRSHALYGWEFRPGTLQELEDVPMHVYEANGESEVTPCGEIYLSDSSSRRLVAAGLIPLVSVRNRDVVLVPGCPSFAIDGSVLRGPWGVE